MHLNNIIVTYHLPAKHASGLNKMAWPTTPYRQGGFGWVFVIQAAQPTALNDKTPDLFGSGVRLGRRLPTFSLQLFAADFSSSPLGRVRSLLCARLFVGSHPGGRVGS